jgi:hypothetical protein
MFLFLFIALNVGTLAAITKDCDGKFEFNGIKLYSESTKCKTTAECLEEYRLRP